MGQEWIGFSATAVLSHGLGAAWVKCGLGMNVSVALKMQQRHHLHYVQQIFFKGDLNNVPPHQPLGLRLIILLESYVVICDMRNTVSIPWRQCDISLRWSTWSIWNTVKCTENVHSFPFPQLHLLSLTSHPLKIDSQSFLNTSSVKFPPNR